MSTTLPIWNEEIEMQATVTVVKQPHTDLVRYGVSEIEARLQI